MYTTAGVHSGKTVQGNLMNGADHLSFHSTPPHLDLHSGGPLHNSYGRDQSTSRGRNPTIGSSPGLSVQSQLNARALSPRIGVNGEEIPSRPGTANVDKRRSRDYGHNRQTSIIQGVHHSRNNSQNNSPYGSRSPHVVSPEQDGIARTGFSYGLADQFDFRTGSSAASTAINSINYSSTSTLAPSYGGEGSFSSVDGEALILQSNNAGNQRLHGRKDSKPLEPRPVVEYALHHLFNSFVGRADFKMDQCVAGVPETFARVEDVCGPGVDQDFDALLAAMGHIARQKPRQLVDTIMFWRRSKSEQYAEAQQRLLAAKAATNRSAPRPSVPNEKAQETPDQPSDLMTLMEKVVQAERKLTLAIYLICRVLVEVYQQSDLKSIGESLDKKLQELIFDQLLRLEPDKVYGSPFYYANWNIYGQLIGEMSAKSFVSSSRHFIEKLQKLHDEAGPKGTVTKETDARLELLVRALSYMSIGTRTETQWRESCEFMHSLATIFVNSHGQPIKHAFCQAIELLVLPLASISNPQLLAAQKWKEFLNLLNIRLNQMLNKPTRHWSEASPLYNLLLCVSPSEIFTHHWQQSVNALQPKLKDKATRGIALQSISRLVWTYLDRNLDSNIVKRKLEEIIKIVLPSSKKQSISAEPAFADPIIQLARIIGFRFPDFCFKNMVSPLINYELFNSGREIKVEQLEPDRIVIGIRAFLAVLEDIENRERGAPPFPAFDLKVRQLEPLSPGVVGFLKNADQKFASNQKDDKFSRPVVITKLDPVSRDYYATFCEVLGKITLICNTTFGGQATLEERIGGQTPKTPISESFSFSRREDPLAPEVRQGYYDLLHVSIQALPRCFSSHIPFKPLVNLLCTGTAHAHSNIASSAATSLKAIASQYHAQLVASGFGRYLFDFDTRYSTMSDDGLLGPGHIQSTLQLYVDLLKIWIEEIKQKTRNAGTLESLTDGQPNNRGLQLDLTNITGLVEEVESHGLFFLCSQSKQVRSYAVTVLRLITEFDAALGRKNSRIIQILEGDIYQVISPDDDRLTVAERSRLEKGKRKGTGQITLAELCSSDVSYDSTLWFKVFPNVIRLSFSQCQITVTMGRGIVCTRLLQMHNMISALAEGIRGPQAATFDRLLGRLGSTPQESIIEQWKLYLIMACTTLTNAGAQTQSQLAHARSKSKGPGSGSEQIGSARSLFAFIIPLLSATSSSIRESIVIALGSINTSLYRTLLESLQYAVTSCNEAARARVNAHQRTGSSPRPDRATDRLRTEVTHVYKLTSRFLQEEEVLRDEWIIRNLVTYTNNMKRFLSDTDIQSDWEFQTLRRHYCGLMEEVFEGLNRTQEPSRYLSFDDRKAAFSLMEDWCGYSPNQTHIALREDGMKQTALNQQVDIGDRTNLTAAMEIQKRDLRTAALSAMASLCAGPVSVQVVSEGRVIGSVSFDIHRIMAWINEIFGTVSDKTHVIGRRALKNLIVYNKSYPRLLEYAIDQCFVVERPKALESYFEVVTGVLTEIEDYPLPFWRVLVAVLFNLGNEKSMIRSKSAKLLRTLEQRQQKSSKLQDFDISISDKTTAVYKLAQFEISKRLAKQHSEQAFFVFSQFALHYKDIHSDNQRNMIVSILPWIQVIELKVDSNGSPTSQTYMFLANLLEITTRSSTSLHNEVQALWQALATGPHGGNVQVVLDFVISLCIDRREQSFVGYAKQIVVFLSSTPAGQKVVDFLLLQITPKNMVHSEKKPMDIAPDTLGLPYIADLGEALPIGNKQSGFSLGQLALILLVDLMVAPVKLSKEHVPLLLQVCLVLWDHYTPLVQEQAREMLVHLIHELVISKIDDDASTSPTKRDIEDFVEAIRQSKSNISWNYQENNSKDDEESEPRVPSAMNYVTSQVIDLFSLAYPNIHESWAKTTLNWATSCSVRHLACRSFQLFRCMLSALDNPMLADMLARLSNTIADESPDVQSFSMEILATLKTIIASNEATDLLRYPQLFWVTCACLNTVNEREFIETLNLLEVLLVKVDLSDPAVVKLLSEAQPPRWEGTFEGIMPLVYKGLKSGNSIIKTVNIINKTACLPNSNLIGDESRLLFGILANLPTYLQAFNPKATEKPDIASAEALATVADQEGHQDIANVLINFYNKLYVSKDEFLSHTLIAVRRVFFPAFELKSLIFLIGLLTNRLPWFILNVIEILCIIVPEIDMRRPEVASLGPDLISPLLRLLQTQYCPQALKVMDHIMYLYSTSNDRQYMRMSMVAAGSRSLRKEYDKTKSLYGIPEETGWSIPMPAIHSNSTRSNVHAVFFTCLNKNDTEQVETTATPEIEFDADEFQQGSYFPVDRSDGIMSEDMRDVSQYDNNVGDILSKLDSLDDFFDDDPDSENKYLSGYSDITITGYNLDTDRGTSLYDQQTAPILERIAMSENSMNRVRSPSVSSLHNPYAEPQPSRPPTAPLNPVITRKPSSDTLQRPALHSRSVTSPSNPTPNVHPTDTLEPDIVEELFSDDERSTGYNNAPSGIEGVIRRNRSTNKRIMADGKEYRQGDLLRGQARLRSKSQAPNSPEVPKVPEAFLSLNAKHD
jgi:hypothetical protein